jgi:hypothetical protein
LVLEGGFTENDRFVYLPLSADEGFLKIWRESMLSLFLKKTFIDQAKATMIHSWVNSGFSVESETRLFTKEDREALGQYVVRGAVSLEKVSYDSATDMVSWKAAEKGFYKGKVETFRSFEFMDQLATHLPPRRVQLVRRYGIYAGRMRSEWPERAGIIRYAPETWQKTHQEDQNQSSQEDAANGDELVPPAAWARLRRQSWARLLQKVYEVDPFLCPKCGGEMHVIAVIEEPDELRKIIEWAQANQVRGPPEVFA